MDLHKVERRRRRTCGAMVAGAICGVTSAAATLVGAWHSKQTVDRRKQTKQSI